MNSQVKDILKKLNSHGESYIVGGAVRDFVMGIVPSDIDIATNVPLIKIKELFNWFDLGNNSEKFGIIGITVGSEVYEIAQFRGDGNYSDGRRPDEVKYVNSIEEDLARRDFTINAMAMSVCGKIIDPFGGLSDIQNKSIRCVGNPDNRISEDYLRILRAIRFAIRFDFTLDEDLILSIKSNVNKLDSLAKERIYDELVKCSQMSGKKFAKVIDCMLTTKALDVILPEISRLNEYDHDKESHPEGNVFRHTLSALECSEYRDSTTNLAILFHDVGKPDTFKLRDGKHTYYGHDKTGLVIIDSVANRLRFPSKLKSYIKFCCENHMKFHGIEKMKLSKVAKLMESPTHWDTLKRVSFCDDIARIKDRDFSRIKTKILNIKVLESKVKASLELSKFLDGKLVMSIRGIESGKDVGNILKYVKSKVLDGKIKPDYDEVVLAIKSCNLLKNGEEI